jgi:hypothetical protein
MTEIEVDARPGPARTIDRGKPIARDRVQDDDGCERRDRREHTPEQAHRPRRFRRDLVGHSPDPFAEARGCGPGPPPPKGVAQGGLEELLGRHRSTSPGSIPARRRRRA